VDGAEREAGEGGGAKRGRARRRGQLPARELVQTDREGEDEERLERLLERALDEVARRHIGEPDEQAADDAAGRPEAPHDRQRRQAGGDGDRQLEPVEGVDEARTEGGNGDDEAVWPERIA